MSAGAYEYSQGRSRVLTVTYNAPVAASSTAVHAAVTDNGSAQVVTTGITQPDMARNVSATAGGTAANITAVAVTVKGTDMYGNPISETLPAFTAGSAGTVTGSKAFGTVTEIDIPANGTGVTTSVGVGGKLGFPVKLSRNTIIFTFVDGVRDSLGADVTLANDATHLENNTVSFSTAPNGSHVYLVDYYNNG